MELDVAELVAVLLSELVDVSELVAVLLLEALALLGFWWLTGRGLAPRSVFALVLPGVFFALALRAAIEASSWIPPATTWTPPLAAATAVITDPATEMPLPPL